MKKLKNYIDESLVKSYDTEKLISVIYKKYPNITYNYYKSKSKEFIFTIYFKNEEDYINFQEDIYILKKLDFFGYYITEISNKDKFIMIEPNFDTKCTDFVYNKCNGLVFHVTSMNIYEKYIKFRGLKTFGGDIVKYRYFKERIFLSCGETKQEIVDNIKFIINQLNIINPAILMIDLKDHNYNVDFYYDPYEDEWHNFIYCNAWFPYKYVDLIEDANDINLNIREDLTYDKKIPWARTRLSENSLYYRLFKDKPHLYL